tara:strand:- start:1147 stop:1452 length:306 start_codon:yes stop_codon:yes gene_type:complete
MDEWILVLDEGDSLSDEQLAVCQSLKPALKGALVCKQRTEANDPLCEEVEHFPAFCHVSTNSCVYGLRTEMEDFEALATMPVPPRTTGPPPPPTGTAAPPS